MKKEYSEYLVHLRPYACISSERMLRGVISLPMALTLRSHPVIIINSHD